MIFSANPFFPVFKNESPANACVCKSKFFQITIKNIETKNYVGSVGINAIQNGTKIELKKELSQEEQTQLISFVMHAFQTNKKINIILNGTKINELECYNSQKPHFFIKDLKMENKVINKTMKNLLQKRI